MTQTFFKKISFVVAAALSGVLVGEKVYTETAAALSDQEKDPLLATFLTVAYAQGDDDDSGGGGAGGQGGGDAAGDSGAGGSGGDVGDGGGK